MSGTPGKACRTVCGVSVVVFNSFVKMTCVILPLAEGESRPARSAAAGGQFGDFLCKAAYLLTGGTLGTGVNAILYILWSIERRRPLITAVTGFWSLWSFLFKNLP